jgi:RimJ/RimL family protein N-acetyltransferase
LNTHPALAIRETTRQDLKRVQKLWSDGDVMRYVGFPEGLHKTDEGIEKWYEWIQAARPMTNHYGIFENGMYCGETFYRIDEARHSASMDIKLFRFARGRGIAAKALSFAIDEAFRNGAVSVWVDPNPQNRKAIALYERLGFERKPMPDALRGEEESPSIYMERAKCIL